MTSESNGLSRTLAGSLLNRWTWRMAWRDSRTQRLRLAIFSLAIASGIAGLVAIQSLKVSVDDGIQGQAKELLGADLQVSSRKAISEEDIAKFSRLAKRVSREVAFPTMVSFPDGSAKLVHVRALEGGYPFYGRIETVPSSAWADLGEGSGVIMDPTLFDQFGVSEGDEIGLGTLRLKILGGIAKAAPSASRFSAFAPEIYVRHADIQNSGLMGPNSMVTHLLHLEIPEGPSGSELKEKVNREFTETGWRLETPEDRKETLGDALDLFQRYLGILAFASLALGALGVAGAVHSHINRRVPTIAILRCLGASRQLAAAVYIAQTAALGLVGAIAGSMMGIVIQLGVLHTFKDSLPISLDASVEWKVVIRTTLAGFAVCCGFALIPLLRIRHVSPAVTLRAGLAHSGGLLRAIPVYLALVALLVGLAFINDPDWKRAAALVGALAAAFLVVAGVARALMGMTRLVVRPTWPYLLRQGISNLYRPGNQTLLFLLSLGLGTFLLLTILLAGNLLQQRIRLPETGQTPSVYLVDVQPDQVEGVSGLVKSHNLPIIESAPMVTMRILSVRGVPVGEAKGLPRWIASREFRSTYRDHLNPTESVIQGSWHGDRPTAAGGVVPVSLEESLARDMRVTIGDSISLDVQGVTIDASITSIRKVDWSRFGLNFFMIFPSGVLEGAPGFQVITTRTPDAAATGRLQRALAAEFPNVSSMDLTQVFATVRDIVAKISLVVGLMGGLTLFAAVPIVIGTLLNGRDVRVRESVLLRTLGASARQVRFILLIEYAALGGLSALTGIVLAVAASSGLATLVFKAPFAPDTVLIGGAFLLTTVLSVIGGMVLSRGVTVHPPLEILRQQ